LPANRPDGRRDGADWFYSKGGPVERAGYGDKGTFAELTNEELKAKLAADIAALS
jgi:hypothetical protein